ncbi:MAG: hypothetical protein WBN68_06275 [Sedimenticolaceae bacterium]
MLLGPAFIQKKACAACGKASAAQIVTMALNRGGLTDRIENPNRIQGLFDAAREPFTDIVEEVKDGCFTVAMPKKYGTSADFCDLGAAPKGPSTKPIDWCNMQA